jgi:DNA-binding NarL/FixJ family response regulator
MPEESKIKILLVDDSVDLAHLYRLTMELEPDMQCVGCLSSTKSIRESVASLSPDIVLIDFVIPGENVLGAVSELRAMNPELHILMLTGYEAPEAEAEARRAGASGYISKNDEPEAVLSKVRESFRAGASQSAAHGR